MPAGHPDTYYAATAPLGEPLPALAGEVDCDVCVVGGGLTGCSAALHLAERGLRVVLLESRRIGWGASGRNGGQLVLGYAKDMTEVEARVGREDARRLWDMAVEAMELVRANVSRRGIDCDLRAGLFVGAARHRDMDWAREVAATLAARYGYDRLAVVPRGDVGRYVASEAYHGGLYDPGSGHLHPLKYLLGLLAAARAGGAQVFEGTPMLRLHEGARPVVETPAGRVRARFVALCGNAYLGRVVPGLDRTIMPAGTFVMTTVPLGAERLRELIPAGCAVSDTKFVLDYYRPTADDRLLFGGGVTYAGRTPADIAQALRPALRRVLPQAGEPRITHAWAGDVAITINRLPHLGRLAPNVLFAHGFSGQGLALTGLAGRLMAEVVAGTAERFDVFARIPHRAFPGGRLLRTPALVLATAWYRMRDLL